MNVQSQVNTNVNCTKLSGSVAQVCEYLGYAVDMILFQRNIYPIADFESTTMYNMPMFRLKKKSIADWIADTLTHVKKWLLEKRLIRFSLLIEDAKTKKKLERWDFAMNDNPANRELKSVKRIHIEMSQVMRQIMASVTILPVLEDECTFHMTVLCIPGTVFPPGWTTTIDDSISNAEDIQFRSIETGFHAVAGSVHFSKPSNSNRS
ncbi:uncharacterized protein LOC132263203 [Phlebotomus argentipes]|uniref:uncharacterized protein LOC132263203 n=1 Tax=Phlebotomus argentipes TaxID=94469 RepID=UPI0028934EB1|nr:uncharacterized protein LOC132263203 [Phlebotomus argentipes]